MSTTNTGKKRVLFLTTDSPFSKNSPQSRSSATSKLRDAQIIALLSEKMEVEVLCFDDAFGEEPPAPIKVSRIPASHPSPLKKLFSLFKPDAVGAFHPKMADELKQRAGTNKILWVSRLAMAQYIPLGRSLGYQVILDEHHVESSVMLKTAFSSMKHWHESIFAAQCAYYEERFCNACHAVVASSDIDASRLHKLAPQAQVHVIPNSVNSPSYADIRKQNGNYLFFPGDLHTPSHIEGMQWFLAEILPRLKLALGKELPSVIVADAKPDPVMSARLERAGVQIYSEPGSNFALLADSSVVFVPLKSTLGSTVQVQVLEAMAAGRAVISTGKGVEGLVLSPTYDVWVADKADSFTSALLKLIRDPALRNQTGEHAAKTVEERYDWKLARPLLERLLGTLHSKENHD